MVDKPSLPHVDEIRWPGSDVCFCLTKWKVDQLKVTFLPALVQTAVFNSCRVIIMIENTGDWPLLGVTVPNEASLTVNDVALDIVLESEARSNAGDVTLTWLRSVDKRTGLPLWEQGDSSGHRCCILRVASWTKGLAPMAATISAFWKLYRR